MKSKTILNIISSIFFLGIHISGAQVGIGTVSPEGVLDLESSSQGIVYPRVALNSTALASPVVNPNGVNLAIGTTVYNTELTQNGADDVSPGIYVWDGSEWLPQHLREDYRRYSQTGGCQRTTIRESTSNPNPNDVDLVSGLSGEIFTPKYSGIYRIEIGANFAAGAIDDFTSDDAISLATSEGAFFFAMQGTGVDIDPTSSIFDYTEGWMYTHSYSTFNSIESPDLEDNTVPHFSTLVFYKYLLAEHDYTFTLSNNINTGHDYFLNNGDSENGQGHIGHDQPCSVEFTFMDK